MLRPLALSLAAGAALLTTSLNGAAESFPVVHNEPITVRILGGKDGLPLTHVHLILLGGYDQRDLHDQLFRVEVLTDAHGQARLSRQLANLPWLQVWVATKLLCQAKARGESFSVDLIRRDGLSAPNRCGTAVVEDAAGIFTVFVKSKAKNAVAKTFVARAEALTPAPVSVATALSVAKVPTRKPAEAEARPPTAQIPAVASAQAMPAAPAQAEKVIKPTEPARPVAVAPLSVPTPAMAVATALPPTAIAAKDPPSSPAKAKARPVRRASRRPVSHRARPVLASCQVRHPAGSERRAGKPATAIDATNKTKPSAGISLAAATPGKPEAPPKQE